MPTIRINDLELFREVTGRGEPLVLVHGSWVDHSNWMLVAPSFAENYQVVTYDRRGHSQSQTKLGQGQVADDVNDLAGIIEGLQAGPVHVVGNSFGASIALMLATERPELFQSLSAHEPPLIGLLAGNPAMEPILTATSERLGSLVKQLSSGDIRGGTTRFVDEVALGPGGWESLPEEAKQVFLANALTWVDEMNEPGAYGLDLRALGRFPAPVLLSIGTTSAPFFAPIAETIAGKLPNVKRLTFLGAGHVPHLTHPHEYVAAVTSFLDLR